MHQKNKKLGGGEDRRKSSNHHAIHALQAIVKIAGFSSELCFDMTGGVRRSRSNGEWGGNVGARRRDGRDVYR